MAETLRAEDLQVEVDRRCQPEGKILPGDTGLNHSYAVWWQYAYDAFGTAITISDTAGATNRYSYFSSGLFELTLTCTPEIGPPAV